MDDVALAHRHGNQLVEMRLIGTDRSDFLAVKQYRCECGVSRAILEHADLAASGAVAPWPYPKAAHDRSDGRVRAAD